MPNDVKLYNITKNNSDEIQYDKYNNECNIEEEIKDINDSINNKNTNEKSIEKNIKENAYNTIWITPNNLLKRKTHYHFLCLEIEMLIEILAVPYPIIMKTLLK